MLGQVLKTRRMPPLFRDTGEEFPPFRTLELRGSASQDGSALARNAVRVAEAGGRSSRSYRVYASGGDAPVQESYDWRLWWAVPDRWRDEIIWASGATDIALVRGEAALTYVAAMSTMYTSDAIGPDERWARVDPPVGITELPTIENRLGVFQVFRPPLPTSEWSFATEADDVAYLGRRCATSERNGERAGRRPKGRRVGPGSTSMNGLWTTDYAWFFDSSGRLMAVP